MYLHRMLWEDSRRGGLVAADGGLELGIAGAVQVAGRLHCAQKLRAVCGQALSIGLALGCTCTAGCSGCSVERSRRIRHVPCIAHPQSLPAKGGQAVQYSTLESGWHCAAYPIESLFSIDTQMKPLMSYKSLSPPQVPQVRQLTAVYRTALPDHEDDGMQ